MVRNMKKIIIGILSAMAVCTTSVGAVNISDLDISWEEPRVFTVRGTSDSGESGERVSFQVLNPGKSLQPGTNPKNTDLVKLYQTETGENGEFTFSFDIENVTSNSGEFTLRVKNAAEDTDPTEVKFNYYSKDEVNAVTEKISAYMGKEAKDEEAISGIAAILNEEARSVYFNSFPLYDSVKESEVINDASECLSYMELTADGKQMMENIRLAILIAASENNFIELDELFDKYSDDFGISDSDEYKLYSEYTDVYKNSFNSFFTAQKSGKILSAEKYVKAFNDSIVLTELSKANGVGAVDEVLEKFNTYFDMTKYQESIDKNQDNKDTICDKIAKGFEQNTIKSILEVQSILDTNISSGQGGGGGTASGGGGSASGGGGSSNGGSSIGTTIPSYVSSKPSVSSEEPASVTSQVKSSFGDLEGVAWAKDEIEYLAERGVLSGYSNDVFAPNDNLTRAQTCKILCKVFSLSEETTESAFTDVSDDAWYKGFVMGAYKSGIVNGYSENLFGAEQAVTRQDFVVMMMRALEKYEIELSVNETDDTSFTDEDQISDYALESVKKFKSASIINGKDDGNFEPLGNITRAEAAKIIYKVKNIYEGRE